MLMMDSSEPEIRQYTMTQRNNVREIRETMLISKAELARRAGISPITVDRIENGAPCRMETKRKIILALSMQISDKDKVFPEQYDA